MPPGSVRRGLRDVVSAGVVVFGPEQTVLLVHRPRYDDWSFPKGKLDPGEHAAAAAVREVEEETGLRVRLGPPLTSQRYPIREGMKTVGYWTGRPVGADDVSSYEPNDEIDAVRWVTIDAARRQLTYTHDVETLEEAVELRKRTRTLVVLRHAVSRSRRTWSRNDRLRPLLVTGKRQAERLVPVLTAFGVDPPGQLGQHPVRADPRALCRRGRPQAGARRRLQRGGRDSQGGPPSRHRARRPAGGVPPPHGRCRAVHPPAGPPVRLRRVGGGGPQARQGRAAGGPPASRHSGRHRATPSRVTGVTCSSMSWPIVFTPRSPSATGPVHLRSLASPVFRPKRNAGVRTGVLIWDPRTLQENS